MARPEDAALGARLKAARTDAGFSQEQIAAAIGVPRSAISMIESGERSLASSELGRLAQVYGWAPETLLFDQPSQTQEGDEESVVLRYFRTEGELPSPESPWLSAADIHWRAYADVEQKLFGSQRWILPSYPQPAGRAFEQGEHLAVQERRRLGLGTGPVRSMIDLLEAEGIKVLLRPFNTDLDIAGCYFFSNDLGPCVVVNEDDLPARRRFTEAHEYCHFLVDREAVEGEICGPKRSHEQFEKRANAFSAAFLLPAVGIHEALDESDIGPGEIAPEDVVHLMYRFGVSREAVVWRLLNLRLINSNRRQQLAKFPVKDLRERLGYDLDPGQTESRPDRYRRLAVDAWRSKLISTNELADAWDLPVADIKKMFQRRQHSERPPAKRLVAEPDWL